MKRKLLKWLCLVLTLCCFSVVFACGEESQNNNEEQFVDFAEGSVKTLSFDLDISDKTEGFYIGSNKISKVELDGVATSDFVVRNEHLLLSSGIYAKLGVGAHKVNVTYKTKSLEFTLNLVDEENLKYDASTITDFVVPVNGLTLPEVYFEVPEQEKTVTYKVSKGVNDYPVSKNDVGMTFTPDSLGLYSYSVKIERKGETVLDKVYSFYVVENGIYESFGNIDYQKPTFSFATGNSLSFTFNGKSMDDYKGIIDVIGNPTNNYYYEFGNDTENFLGLKINLNHENLSKKTGLTLCGKVVRDAINAGINTVNLDYTFISFDARYTSSALMELYFYDASEDKYTKMATKNFMSEWAPAETHGVGTFSLLGLNDVEESDYLLFDIPRNGNEFHFNSLVFNHGINTVNLELYKDGVEVTGEEYESYLSKLVNTVGTLDIVEGKIDITEFAENYGPAGFEKDEEKSVFVSEVTIDWQTSFKVYYLTSTKINLLPDGYGTYFTVNDAGYGNNAFNYDADTGSVVMSIQSGWDYISGLYFKEDKLLELYNQGYSVITVKFYLSTIKSGDNSWFEFVYGDSVAINEAKQESPTQINTITLNLTEDYIDGLRLSQYTCGTTTVITSITIDKPAE